MKHLFTLFVLVHLLIDLAAPSLPGAFRFNPDESVVAVKVQAVQAQDFRPASQPNPGKEFSDLFRPPRQNLAQPGEPVPAPDLVTLLPRRDPSADRSLPSSPEDH